VEIKYANQAGPRNRANRDEYRRQFEGLEVHRRQLNKKPEQHKAALVWKALRGAISWATRK